MDNPSDLRNVAVHAPRGGAGRRRNARGEGGRLAEEIVAGAIAIIERTGSDEEVTLRSVAREVGIAAPSIYTHFPDREAILWAVVQVVFDWILVPPWRRRSRASRTRSRGCWPAARPT